MKQIPTDGPALAAYLLNEVISRYERNPDLRRQSGIDLKKLAEVASVRRKLLKSISK